MSNYLITGANSEIGNALCHYIEEKGHNLLLISRSKKDDNLSKKFPWYDGLDLTKENDLLYLRQVVKNHFSSTFTLIHCVGDFWKHKSIGETIFQEAISMIQSHYITLFGTIKSIIPIMHAVGGGNILAISCNSVKYNYPEMAAFTSTKAAVECLIKCIANEQAKYNITANSIALPSIRTKNVIKTKPEEFQKDYVTLDELVGLFLNIAENLTPLINGNIINLFKYSENFYHKGYYERNIIWEENNIGHINGIL